MAASVLAGGLSHLAHAAPPVSRPDDLVVRRLKEALMESEARLGGLEPWQKRLFDEEAVPQYQRFIRDYRRAQTHSGTANSSLSVDIDLESLKNYLRFYAPKALKAGAAPDTSLVVRLSADETCFAQCVAAVPAVRKLVAARLSRRGFRPIWLEAEDLGEPAPQGKALREKAASLAEKRGAAGALVVEWGKAAADPDDTAHADEVSYQMSTSLDLRSLGFRNEGRMEVMSGDGFEAAFARLATDAFTELGGRLAMLERSAPRSAGEEEAEVRVALTAGEGAALEFAQLAAAKAALQGKFPEAAVQERLVARGRATLAVVGEGDAAVVSKALAEIRSGNKGEGSARMEIEAESDGSAP